MNIHASKVMGQRSRLNKRITIYVDHFTADIKRFSLFFEFDLRRRPRIHRSDFPSNHGPYREAARTRVNPIRSGGKTEPKPRGGQSRSLLQGRPVSSAFGGIRLGSSSGRRDEYPTSLTPGDWAYPYSRYPRTGPRAWRRYRISYPDPPGCSCRTPLGASKSR